MEVIIISMALGAAITHTAHLVTAHVFKKKMLLAHGHVQAQLDGVTKGSLTLLPVADVPAGTTSKDMGLMYPTPNGMIGLDHGDTLGVATEDIPANAPCVWDIEKGTITPIPRGNDNGR